MKNNREIHRLAHASIMHEYHQQYEQTCVQRLILLHQQLKYKNRQQLLQLKKQILSEYDQYSFADYIFETLVLEIEIRLYKLNIR